MWKTIMAALAITLPLPATLTLTSPGGPETGFFQGQSGTYVGALSSAQLPAEFGVAGHKVYGTASVMGTQDSGAPLVVLAMGGIAGTLDQDVVLQVNYHFTATTDAPSIPWYVEGLVGTSLGGYYGNAEGTMISGEEVAGSFFLVLNGAGPSQIPAGTEAEAWILYMKIGDAGVPGPPLQLTVTIPPNTLEIRAFGARSEIPEPSSAGLLGLGLAAALAVRRGNGAKSC